MRIKKNSVVKIKPTEDAVFENIQGKLLPRIYCTGVVLGVTKHGLVLVNIINDKKDFIFKECFFESELEVVSFDDTMQLCKNDTVAKDVLPEYFEQKQIITIADFTEQGGNFAV